MLLISKQEMITCFTSTQSPDSTETSWYGAFPQLFSPKLLADWSVCESQHHATVFGSVVTQGMSWISSARLESAQSLWFSQSLPVTRSDKNGPRSHFQLSVITNSLRDIRAEEVKELLDS